ncbi:hypothetical protein [Roseobacter sp. CCS2]|uniref:hypothetical protein n=1 Tax=Roseobacter sp. CCS2 TaxID=391593 RepID=UPI0000F3E03D|nr:hypothetical protein [Roseobacter sp. CCS2]EBA12250.1 hypothetical protein RCCS2_13174 [Roseobacter sp. CCS2]
MRIAATIALASLTLATTANAETDYSAMIAQNGLATTEANLSALPNPTASDQFALGGVRFLGAVEGALQTLYATQINREMAEMSDLPFLRLPLPPNPDAVPFQPEVIASTFAAALDDLKGSLAALDTITDTDDVGVTINTADLWFDINANSTRDAGEGVLEVAASQLNRRLDDTLTPPVVRFDTSDAAWLSAYAHLLSGVSETVLALDPTSAITRVTESAAAMDAFNDGGRQMVFMPDEDNWIDVVAMFIHAIEGRPDVERSRAAHAHFLGMIADNQTFWSRVAAETDNKLEWIPNPNQTSALPLEFPADVGSQWRMVLAEAEAVLKGDLLIPHWRLGDGAGINLAKAMQNPPEIDIIAIIQGEGVLPYLEEGTRMSGRSLTQFQRMLGGDAGLYMIVLN